MQMSTMNLLSVAALLWMQATPTLAVSGFYSQYNCLGSYFSINQAANFCNYMPCARWQALSLGSITVGPCEILKGYKSLTYVQCAYATCVVTSSLYCCNMHVSSQGLGGAMFTEDHSQGNCPASMPGFQPGMGANGSGRHVDKAALERAASIEAARNFSMRTDLWWGDAGNGPPDGADVFAYGSELEVWVPEAGRRFAVPNTTGRVPTRGEVGAALQKKGYNATRAAELADQVYTEFGFIDYSGTHLGPC